MNYPIKSPKKLIEVALPLDAINVAAAREKSIRHGHPSTLHLWWARRPLASPQQHLGCRLSRFLGRGEVCATGKERAKQTISWLWLKLFVRNHVGALGALDFCS